MPTPVEPPHAYKFNRRRTSFTIDIEEVFDAPRNGLRVPVAASPEISTEQDFLHWLARVGGTGSRPEHRAYRALERRGLRAPESEPFSGLDFQFQVPVLGGRAEQGGAVIDLLVWVTAPPTAIRIQGEFFHYGDDAAETADILERIQLEGAGYTVVDVLAQEVLDPQSADRVMGMALNGYQTDFTGKLGVFR